MHRIIEISNTEHGMSDYEVCPYFVIPGFVFDILILSVLKKLVKFVSA